MVNVYNRKVMMKKMLEHITRAVNELDDALRIAQYYNFSNLEELQKLHKSLDRMRKRLRRGYVLTQLRLKVMTK